MLTRPIDKALLDSYSDDIPFFLKKIYAARGVGEQQLSLSLADLLKPNFDDLDHAIALLEDCLNKQKKILIVGDFDADGATASVVAIKALRAMGAMQVDFLVPNRFEHGYGLSPAIVELAHRDKQADLIITVDNGIASFDGVELAKEMGMQVIITDHHLPSDTLPKADAIINPNLKGCDFPSKNLAGVGVCFYLFSSLKTHLLNTGYFSQNQITPPDMRTLLDLVALGTVADVVKLDQNNRTLIAEGVKRIRQGYCVPGITALLEIAKRRPEVLQASDLGFSVAPRLNAAGRLSDISRGIQCLLTQDLNDARRYAMELETFNQTRRQEQEKIQAEAEAIVNKQNFSKGKFALSLFDPDWHEGIVGIVAGKLKEMHHCPVAVFARSGEFLKGSIRSIPDVHIKDLLDLIDRKNPNLIVKFGGHAMAAGLSITHENFPKFKQAFSESVKNHLDGQKPQLELLTDGQLTEDQITLDNAQLIADSAPWGQGFEEPIFFGSFEVTEQKIVGEKHLRCRLQLLDGKQVFDGIAFFQDKLDQKQVKMAYKLSVNEWRGQSSLQLMIEQISALE